MSEDTVCRQADTWRQCWALPESMAWSEHVKADKCTCPFELCEEGQKLFNAACQATMACISALAREKGDG